MSKDTIHLFNNLSVKGIIANGNIGTAGQALVSNGTAVYWGAGAGTTGFTGSTGNVGFTGSTGNVGFTGSIGVVGYTGSLGAVGYQGSLGAVGYTGSLGLVGYTGSTGFRGSAGFNGSTGFTGSAGITGFTGSIGNVGYNGSTGFTGSLGGVGYQGSLGSVGYQGSAGVGYAGSQGLIGFTGSSGFTGSKGADGGQLTAGSYVVRAVKNGSAQTVSNGSDATVTLIDDFDPNNWFASNRFQPTVAGYYSLDASVWWDAGAVTNNQTNIQFKKNGTTQLVIDQTQIVTGSGYGQSLSTIAYLNGSTDYVELTAYTGNTTSQNINGSASGTYFVAALYAYGPPGYTGSVGSQGVTGFTGSFGTAGFTGSVGSQGIIGFTGSVGSQGTTGFTGSVGSQGVIGFTGSVGFAGSVGSQGIIGFAGSRGFSGSAGYNGSVGFTGSVGSQGVTGFTGSVGFAGSVGYTGSTGNPFGGGTFTGQIITATPSSYTAITSVTADTAKIRVPEVNVGGAAGFVPALGQTSVWTSGYRQHLVIGNYRTASTWDGGMFVGLGGNDSNPTEYFLMNYGGSISHSGGYITTTGSSRSPIFYDSNNTSCYVDPESGSVLGGQVLFAGGTKVATNGDVYARRDSATTGVYYFADGGSKYLYWDGSQYFFGNAGVVVSPTSFRAPIFYDSDNTAYYIDLAGSTALLSDGVVVAGTQGFQSRFYSVNARNRIWSFNNADGYGISYFQGTAGTISADTIGFHFGTATAAASTLQVIGNNYTLSLGSMRAPLFYDSDDTGWYCDPNSTSKFSTLGIQTPPSASSYLNIGGNNNYGGTGYNGFLTIYNSYGSATNPYQYWRLNGSGGWEIVNSAYNAVLFTFTQGGDLTAAGNVTAYSDRRLKDNFEPITDAVAKVLQLNGVTFTRIDKEDRTQRYAGLIAQDVKPVLPEAVQKNDTMSYGEILSVDYNGTIALLVEAIKEQEAHINRLEERINRG